MNNGLLKKLFFLLAMTTLSMAPLTIHAIQPGTIPCPDDGIGCPDAYGVATRYWENFLDFGLWQNARRNYGQWAVDPKDMTFVSVETPTASGLFDVVLTIDDPINAGESRPYNPIDGVFLYVSDVRTGPTGGIHFGEAEINVNKNVGVSTFSVVRTRDKDNKANGKVSVDYKIIEMNDQNRWFDMGAKAGTDYLPTSGTVVFEDNVDSFQTFNVKILADGLADETHEKLFQIILCNPKNLTDPNQPVDVTFPQKIIVRIKGSNDVPNGQQVNHVDINNDDVGHFDGCARSQSLYPIAPNGARLGNRKVSQEGFHLELDPPLEEQLRLTPGKLRFTKKGVNIGQVFKDATPKEDMKWVVALYYTLLTEKFITGIQFFKPTPKNLRVIGGIIEDYCQPPIPTPNGPYTSHECYVPPGERVCIKPNNDGPHYTFGTWQILSGILFDPSKGETKPADDIQDITKSSCTAEHCFLMPSTMTVRANFKDWPTLILNGGSIDILPNDPNIILQNPANPSFQHYWVKPGTNVCIHWKKNCVFSFVRWDYVIKGTPDTIETLRTGSDSPDLCFRMPKFPCGGDPAFRPPKEESVTITSAYVLFEESGEHHPLLGVHGGTLPLGRDQLFDELHDKYGDGKRAEMCDLTWANTILADTLNKKFLEWIVLEPGTLDKWDKPSVQTGLKVWEAFLRTPHPRSDDDILIRIWESLTGDDELPGELQPEFERIQRAVLGKVDDHASDQGLRVRYARFRMPNENALDLASIYQRRLVIQDATLVNSTCTPNAIHQCEFFITISSSICVDALPETDSTIFDHWEIQKIDISDAEYEKIKFIVGESSTTPHICFDMPDGTFLLKAIRRVTQFKWGIGGGHLVSGDCIPRATWLEDFHTYQYLCKEEKPICVVTEPPDPHQTFVTWEMWNFDGVPKYHNFDTSTWLNKSVSIDFDNPTSPAMCFIVHTSHEMGPSKVRMNPQWTAASIKSVTVNNYGENGIRPLTGPSCAEGTIRPVFWTLGSHEWGGTQAQAWDGCEVCIYTPATLSEGRVFQFWFNYYDTPAYTNKLLDPISCFPIEKYNGFVWSPYYEVPPAGAAPRIRRLAADAAQNMGAVVVGDPLVINAPDIPGLAEDIPGGGQDLNFVFGEATPATEGKNIRAATAPLLLPTLPDGIASPVLYRYTGSDWVQVPNQSFNGTTLHAHITQYGNYQVFARLPATSQPLDFGDIYVYPNPVKGDNSPTLHIEVGVADRISTRVYDVAGDLVYETQVETTPIAVGSVLAYEIELPRKNFKPGVYSGNVTAEKAGQTTARKPYRFTIQ